MNYNNAQLQQLWTSQGGDASVADTMAAIALAESSGNPTDVNSSATEGKSGSWGLWQINGDAHPQYDHQSLLNPQTNAAAAVAVYASQGLGAWSTYSYQTIGGKQVFVGKGNGSYRKFLSGANTSSGAGAGANTSVLSQVVQTSENPLVLLNNWVTSPNVDVLYKALALCAVLILFGAIAPTQRFAGWAALCILFVLLIQQQPKKAAQNA